MISIEGLTGRVVLPGSPDYHEARQNYNGRFHKFPAVIVYCAVTEDVVHAILWARKHRVPFRIRSGGHSYEAYSLISGGMVIDVSEMVNLELDKVRGTVEIGPGIRVFALYETLWRNKVTVPTGTCAGVGISGITLGGGYGVLSRLMGMTCDNLLEVEMVNAQGKVLRANVSQHPDLLWACRGGGDGSFGVITSLTYRIHPIENVSRYNMTWDFADLKKVVSYWQEWAPNTDCRLTSLLSLPAPSQGTIRSHGVFVGSAEELRQLILPLQEATRPSTVEVIPTTWFEAARFFGGRQMKQDWFKNTSAYAYIPLCDEALDALIHYLKIAPGPTNVVAFDAYGGVISEVPKTATAFVHREALFVIQYQSYWTPDTEEKAEDNICWIEQLREAMAPYTYGAYRNYCDSMIFDWPIAYFGENLARLKSVKERYDPENFFRFPQSIPVKTH